MLHSRHFLINQYTGQELNISEKKRCSQARSWTSQKRNSVQRPGVEHLRKKKCSQARSWTSQKRNSVQRNSLLHTACCCAVLNPSKSYKTRGPWEGLIMLDCCVISKGLNIKYSQNSQRYLKVLETNNGCCVRFLLFHKRRAYRSHFGSGYGWKVPFLQCCHWSHWQ